MGEPLDLPDPTELEEGTETVVKVQKNIRNEQLSWMVYARNYAHLRLRSLDTLPYWLIDAMKGLRKGYFKATVVQGDWQFTQRVPDEDW